MIHEVPAKLRTIACLVTNIGPSGDLVQLILHYAGGMPFEPGSDDDHLAAVMQWLATAQDACGGKGVSATYHLRRGWAVAYPETSGYIIATYLSYAKLSGRTEYVQRAYELGNWEIAVQADTGGVLSSTDVSHTRVFNTGQVLLGWCTLFESSGDQRYFEAACRAGDYLVKMQDDDGAWRRDTYCGARTYHARVSWALIRLARLSGKDSYWNAAVRNLKWVLEQQNDNGWFRECGFHSDDPITHVLVYTLRGLLESHLYGGANVTAMGLLPAVTAAVDAITRSTEHTSGRFFRPGLAWLLPASFDANWNGCTDWSCLTGNAQFACLLFRLEGATGKRVYRAAGERIVDALKATQNITSGPKDVQGAIGGSWPLYAPYCSNAFPNWAAKFFADALMMRMHPDMEPVSA